MSKRNYLLLSVMAIAIVIFVGGCRTEVLNAKKAGVQPTIFPDYIGVTIPPNMAPLNFTVADNYVIDKIDMVLNAADGQLLHLQAKEEILFPQNKWNAIVAANKNKYLDITVSTLRGKQWTTYLPFRINISVDSIDSYITYRLVAPGYEMFGKMGIYQRRLSDFYEKTIVENTLLQGNCINCHSFCNYNADQMSLHVRGSLGSTIIQKGDTLNLLETRTDSTHNLNCVYPYWHPSGRYIAYSVNRTQQLFHLSDRNRVEVIDLESDIVVYDITNNTLVLCNGLKSETQFETFPAFSPCGKYLYFCSADTVNMHIEPTNVRYDLCRIAFDCSTGTFGQHTDTIVKASAMGKSISFPRPSPDGKYLIYTMLDYGNFPIWHTESDLYMVDLNTMESSPLTAVNSPDVDSYHSWSSNSRWIIFSSRRNNGLYTQPFIAHIDAFGILSKPFLLPQKSPFRYQGMLQSFNIPEFTKNPITINANELETLLTKGKKISIYN